MSNLCSGQETRTLPNQTGGKICFVRLCITIDIPFSVPVRSWKFSTFRTPSGPPIYISNRFELVSVVPYQ